MIRRILYIYCIVFMVWGTQRVSGQGKSFLPAEEDTLRIMLSAVRTAVSDTEKIASNERFFRKMRQVLMLRSSFAYPFDSLKSVSLLTAPDGRFRIITWNLPLRQGTNRYFGFIQVPGDQKGDPDVYGLHDWSDVLEAPEDKKVDTAHWYGALYYRVILCKSAGRSYYTLLGWDGRSPQLTQKLIEILYFDSRSTPWFGLPVFRNYSKERKLRIIFRYSASSTMALRYDEQTIVKKKKWNSKKRSYDLEADKTLMIVCDRLVPLDPAFEGNPAYYVPAGDVYDGFVFSNGNWTYVKNVEARNPGKKASGKAR